MSVFPVFVVGSARSGTSILTQGLRGAGYHGFSEGNFLGVVTQVSRAVDRQFNGVVTNDPRTLISNIDRAELKARLFGEIFAVVSRQHDHRPWMDKTGGPDMIEAIPDLLRQWPSAHFIFAKRRAIENITSRLLKFPNRNFEYHCTAWARIMNAWRLLREASADLPAIEVEQRDIALSPSAAAAEIGAFLGLAPEATAKMAAVFDKGRAQETSPGTRTRLASLTGTGWNEAQQKAFEQICGEEMRAYGYTTDDRYTALRATVDAA